MLTYEDLVAVGNSDKARIDFITKAISEHKNSEVYKIKRITYTMQCNFSFWCVTRLHFFTKGRI